MGVHVWANGDLALSNEISLSFSNSSLALVAKATSHEAEKISWRETERAPNLDLIFSDDAFRVARLGFDIARQFAAIGGQFSHDLLV